MPNSSTILGFELIAPNEKAEKCFNVCCHNAATRYITKDAQGPLPRKPICSAESSKCIEYALMFARPERTEEKCNNLS